MYAFEEKNYFVLPVTCNIMCVVSLETEGFKIDTMGTYHGMTLKSVTVRSKLSCLLMVLKEATEATLQVDFSLSTSGETHL